MPRMNLYQWILTTLKWASDSDTTTAYHYGLDGNGDGKPMEYTEGLDDFIDSAATQFARLMLYPSDKKKDFTRDKFYENMQYFARAVYRLLTEFTPKYSDLTIRLGYMGFPWEQTSVDATLWERGAWFTDTNDWHPTPYGIEYDDWENWLGMTVNHQFFELPADYVLAHVIWEMTYNGQPGDPGYEKRMHDLNDSGEPKSDDGLPLSYPENSEEDRTCRA